MKKHNIQLLVEKDIISEIYQDEIDNFKNYLISNFTEVIDLEFYKKLETVTTSQLKTNNSNAEDTITFIISSGFNSDTLSLLSSLEEQKGLKILVQPLLDIDFLSRHTQVGRNSDVMIYQDQHVIFNTDSLIELDEEEDYKKQYLIVPFANLKDIENFTNELLSGEAVEAATIKKDIKLTKVLQSIISNMSPNDLYKNYSMLGTNSFSSYFVERESFSVDDALFVNNALCPGRDKRSITALFLGNIVEKVQQENTDNNKAPILYKFKEGLKEIITKQHGMENAKAANKVLSLYHMRKNLDQSLPNTKFNKKNKL